MTRCPRKLKRLSAVLDEFDPRRGRSGRPHERNKDRLFVEGAVCWICGQPIQYGLRRNHPLGPSLDHITPLSLGGHPTDPANQAVAHFGCNSRRGNGRNEAVTRKTTRDYS